MDNALRYGLRGLPGGSSLKRLLSQYRGVRNTQDLPPLTEAQILQWAEEHYERTGSWPNDQSGPITDQPGEVWRNINAALRLGRRGLPGKSSLARLLADRLGVRTRANLPALSLPLILNWADAHFHRTGSWPTRRSGPVVDAPGESWHAIDLALHQGYRGLPGGCSLPQLLAEQRPAHNGRFQVFLPVGLGCSDAGEQFQDGEAMPCPTLQIAPQLILDPLPFAHHALPGTFARPYLARGYPVPSGVIWPAE